MHAGDGMYLGLGQLFLHHQLVGQIAATAAPLFVHFGQQKAMGAKAAPGLARHIALSAPGGYMGCQFALYVAAHLLPEGVDLGIHPGMLKGFGQQHVQTPVRPPVHIKVWPLM